MMILDQQRGEIFATIEDIGLVENIISFRFDHSRLYHTVQIQNILTKKVSDGIFSGYGICLSQRELLPIIEKHGNKIQILKIEENFIWQDIRR